MQGLRSLIYDVPDLAAAKRFYAAVLGKEPYFDEPFYVGFDVDGYELGLKPAEGPARRVGYFGAVDVDAEVARLVAHGARVLEVAQDVGDGIRTASVVDPQGNPLGVIRNLEFAPKLVAAGMDDLSPREIRHERIVAKPRDEVWALWSTTAGIVRWLCDEAKIELRVGGAYEVYFLLDQPLGSRGSETCRVLSFLPGRMLSFTWNAPAHLAVVRDQHTWVVVELADAPGGTRVVLTHVGWPASGLRDEPQWDEALRFFERAWTQAMDDLVAFTTTGVKP